MKKASLISLIFGLLVAFALIFALYNKKAVAPDENAVSDPATQQASNRAGDNGPSPQDKSPGIYVDYSEVALAEAKGQKVLFFHAPWCPQCRSIEKSILQDKNSVPPGITILKVDYDTNQKLRQKYGITIQTTFVKIDKSGNLIDKYVAYDEPDIDSIKKNFLL